MPDTWDQLEELVFAYAANGEQSPARPASRKSRKVAALRLTHRETQNEC